MKAIVGGRRSGKTTKLLDWLREAPADEHRVIVSATLEQSHFLQRHALLDFPGEFESWQFVGLTEITESWGGTLWSGVLLRGGHVVLALDDIEIMLGNLVNKWEIKLVTMTTEV